ncbi:PaaI family thioesterase [Fibrella aquatilis]|uniref:PaaI family thioesterase n=1 Tax=Fibrella aquatilis TaxID=2817059 RepID=A0A939G9F8_9BACT|nr:PaaI family thioesterase [Fibrella aquatilis]MBO0934699.1 PaaI family thioesterase [Fibrella aquatilis]
MDTNPRLDTFRTLIDQPMTSIPSGVGRWLGGVLRVVEEGRLVADYIVRDDMVNPMQVLHGGTASAILDDLCGLTVFALGREYGYTSVNLTMDFLNAARLGETLTAEAVVIRAGRNIIHLEGRITNAAGKLIAKCSTNLIQTAVKL